MPKLLVSNVVVVVVVVFVCLFVCLFVSTGVQHTGSRVRRRAARWRFPVYHSQLRVRTHYSKLNTEWNCTKPKTNTYFNNIPGRRHLLCWARLSNWFAKSNLTKTKHKSSTQSDGKPVTWQEVLCTTNTKTKWAQWEKKFLEVAPMTFYADFPVHHAPLIIVCFPFWFRRSLI